jgi:hypothetical protein
MGMTPQLPVEFRSTSLRQRAGRAREATAVIGAWEHEVDLTTARHVLDGDVPVDVTAD